MIIAIDGPAASGKGTLARRLAARFGLAYLDTGALYRAVGHAVLMAGAQPHDEAVAVAAARTLAPQALGDPALRTPEAGRAASIVAAMPAVRAALLDYQRRIAATATGAVLDGRDIGTVVCPDADVKLFITASPEARVERRYRELAATDASTERETVRRDIAERDARDEARDSAPLKKADDAHLLDTSNLDIEAALQAALSIIEGARGV